MSSLKRSPVLSILFAHRRRSHLVMIMLATAGCLLLVFPFVDSRRLQLSLKLAIIERQLFSGISGSNSVAGQSTPPQPQDESPGDAPTEPPDAALDLSGEWQITNTILESSRVRERNVRAAFQILIRQSGRDFQGEGEMAAGADRQGPTSVPNRLKIYGTIANGSSIAAVFREENRWRAIDGRFILSRSDQNRLTGTFVSTSARLRGSSQWIRTSAPPGVPVCPPLASVQEENSPPAAISWWWSWLLTICGVVGLMLAGSQMHIGWLIGIAGQLLWVAYALYTQQWGFLVSAGAFGGVYAWNWWRRSLLPPPQLPDW
jgi:hypothetical protein